MDYELANRQRDRRLRRAILTVLHHCRGLGPQGGMGGRTLCDVVDGDRPADQRFVDDAHALGLLRDLVNKGLIDQTLLERRRTQRFGVEFCFFKITAKGSSLWNESIPADPDIDDERLAGELP